MTGPASAPRACLALAAAAVVELAAYASAFSSRGAPAWAPWAFLAGTVTTLVALVRLGAARGGRAARALDLALAVQGTILVAGFGTALVLPPPTASSPLVLGLPAAAAVVIYGVGLLPVLVLPIAYARTFETLTLSEGDLARVRAARRDASTPA